MRWRVRLYCGHIVETRGHYTFVNPTDAGTSSIATFAAAGPAFRAALQAVADRLEDPNRVIADVVTLANAVAAENADRAGTPPPRTWVPFEMPNT